MKRNKIDSGQIIVNILWFLVGTFVCYILMQYQYFDIKTELDVPPLILSALTALIGLYIAVSIQKKISRSQNQYSYLINKLDAQWIRFNDVSKLFIYDDKIEVTVLLNFTKEIIYPLDNLKTLFASFDIPDDEVNQIGLILGQLETDIESITPVNNVINFVSIKSDIDLKITEVNKSFGKALQRIQDI
jgi:hypothetical protein